MSNGTTCKLQTCDKPVTRGGFCYGHYMKNWRYGTPTPEHPDRWVDIAGQRFGALVVRQRDGMFWVCDCDCGSTARVRAGDLNRGTTTSCGNRTTHRRRDDIGYSMAHDRVRSDRGKVQDYECCECGKPAEHWSYNHTDPDELHAEGLSARPVAYSAKPEHYSPRCIRCHKRFDLGRIDAARLIDQR